MSKDCDLATKKAHGIPHCITKQVASIWREMILPLYSALVRQLECCAACWARQYKRHGHSGLSSVNGRQLRDWNIFHVLKRLKELGLFSLEKEGQKSYKYL